MNIVVLGAAGFIGTNLVKKLVLNKDNNILAVDICEDYLTNIKSLGNSNVICLETKFTCGCDFDELLRGQDVVYHLISTSTPGTSNSHIPEEINDNVIFTAKLLDACVRYNVKKVLFVSSGGTVYGKEVVCPIKENDPTNPITSYGLQKLTIEKLLYLYNCMHGLEYRIVRLSNPYGPYQRPNGLLGAVTTFTYRALNGQDILVYGDGSVVRDYIYIDDAIDAIIKVSEASNPLFRLYNIGSGKGISLKELLAEISKALNIDLKISYMSGRSVDVPVNYLDIFRYEKEFGKMCKVGLQEGILKTAHFLRNNFLQG